MFRCHLLLLRGGDGSTWCWSYMYTSDKICLFLGWPRVVLVIDSDCVEDLV